MAKYDRVLIALLWLLQNFIFCSAMAPSLPTKSQAKAAPSTPSAPSVASLKGSLKSSLNTPLEELPSRWFLFGQLKLHYYHFPPLSQSAGRRRAGSPAAGRPLLLLHANGFPLLTYLPLIEALQQANWQLYGLDFMGHGRSQISSDFSSWYYFRDQILALLEHLQLEEVDIIGHSLGGATALLASALELSQGRERIRSLMLLDPTVLSPTAMFLRRLLLFSSNSLARQAEKRRSQFRSMELVRRSYRLSPLFQNWDRRAFEAYLQVALRPEQSERSEQPERPKQSERSKQSEQSKQSERQGGLALSLPPAIEARIFRSVDNDHWRWYRRVHLPLLIVTPSHSTVCPAASLWRLAKQSSFGMVKFCPDGTHLFPMEMPDWTAEQIISFLKLR